MTDNTKVNDKEQVHGGNKVDPLKLREVSLSNDFYTLCWSCLRTDIWKAKPNPHYDEEVGNDEFLWEDKTIGEEQLSLTDENLRDIKIYMLCFVVTVLYVLVGIIIQVFTGEIEASCNWDIRILRILLVALVEMNLLVEFRQGIVKLKYTYQNEGEFRELWLAKFIPLFQITCVLLSWITLILFICSETDPLSMIQDFTGICVFTELDDWIGGHICSTTPEVPEEIIKEYDFTNINEKISLSMKMSKLQDDTDIIEDLNDDSFLLNRIAYFFYTHKYIIYILPIICIPVEYLYLRYHPYAK